MVKKPHAVRKNSEERNWTDPLNNYLLSAFWEPITVPGNRESREQDKTPRPPGLDTLTEEAVV